MNLFKKILKSIDFSGPHRKYPFIFINGALILFQVLYIWLRYKYINTTIPFWYVLPWGDFQLASKDAIYLLPLTSAGILAAGLIISLLVNRFYIRYSSEIVGIFTTFSVFALTYSLVRIILISSVPFDPIINPTLLSLSVPFMIAFATAYFLIPLFIEYAKDKGLVTNPNLHMHPAMVLIKPSVRGAGFVYAIIFLALTLIFVGYSKNTAGIYLSVLMLGILGIVDDYQNTHQKSMFRILENPLLRLFLLFCGVSAVVLSGIQIEFVSNPFAKGTFDLLTFTIEIGGSAIPVLADIVTMLWIVWLLNLLSWSNGIDGQYSGIIGISSIFLCLLALRFVPLEPIHLQVATMAAISAGIALGFTKKTWYPSSVMWGFGAMSAGLVVAVLSILINTKVVTTVLFLLIPFLDGAVTIIRRIIQKKNPLSGDRGHLHHLLLDRGWSVPKIAMFYWLSTALFGIIGLISSDKYIIQVVLILGGVVASLIVLLNLRSIKKQKQIQESV
ncbi:undecaprenyl/decaprenyl-phosphate alpha-N-acetylglucosaminyl 1-phosphate transferase [candidate division WWE3 bacterium]|jgi:UDP-GlcNAc:undecaprenyl-phosphate GlcNAc-1-phosphate transferase|uniref:Undecaprenyl/decaprenyl-phosphate alpha-N-acetylglucosaminyl 1-phosphate transferase n=1 Tax=candidate division WWE3 bacterium TaxID=2053526 RepID=A0A3A4ZCE4_UNCKA|nr:MAG: undecaprenyl/decaprenyl-phosphate alpha-N-acetylglucosaminyl 1-phosphate transferase [candidate division WWE3 bacterium]